MKSYKDELDMAIDHAEGHCDGYPGCDYCEPEECASDPNDRPEPEPTEWDPYEAVREAIQIQDEPDMNFESDVKDEFPGGF